jgi:hypothetical protein
LENTGSAGFKAGSAGIQILVQPDTQPVFSLVETGSAGFKTDSTDFCTVHFFLPVCCVSQKAVRNFLKIGSTSFCAGKSKTASFGAPPIYTHSYLSPPYKSTHKTSFPT